MQYKKVGGSESGVRSWECGKKTRFRFQVPSYKVQKKGSVQSVKSIRCFCCVILSAAKNLCRLAQHLSKKEILRRLAPQNDKRTIYPAQKSRACAAKQNPPIVFSTPSPQPSPTMGRGSTLLGALPGLLYHHLTRTITHTDRDTARIKSGRHRGKNFQLIFFQIRLHLLPP